MCTLGIIKQNKEKETENWPIASVKVVHPVIDGRG